MYSKYGISLLTYIFFFYSVALKATNFPKDFIEDTPRISHPLLISHWDKAQYFIEILKEHSTTEDNFPEFKQLVLEGINKAKTLLYPNDPKDQKLNSLIEEVNICSENCKLTLPRVLYISLKTSMVIDPTHRLLQFHKHFKKEKSKGWDYSAFLEELSIRGDDNLTPLSHQGTIPQLPIIDHDARFGLQTWNFLWVNGVLPIGVPLKKDAYIHGRKYTFYESILHDLQHNFSHTLNATDFLTRITLFKKVYHSIQKEERIEDFKKAHFGFFLINHEFTPKPIREKELADSECYKAYFKDMWERVSQGFRLSFDEALAIDMEILTSLYPQAQLTYIEDEEAIHIKEEKIIGIEKVTIDQKIPFRKKTDTGVQLERLINYSDYVPLLTFVGYPQKDKKLLKILRNNKQEEIEYHKNQLIALYQEIRNEVIDLLQWFENRYAMRK
ncbi:MAG: hypothetical protein K2W92_07935 [Alphaproteobacteria bacterium]|nr:hypothetical protein [Alphaproteobacteria bacterium]